MPVVIFFACLDLEQKSSFPDGHYLVFYESFKKIEGRSGTLISLKTIRR
jgi:hypothetical protein